MILELAEPRKKKNVFVQGYDRSANYVPGYSRRRPHLNDSSLFSFKLAEELAGKVITNESIFITVPDPLNQKAPRRVRLDMFNNLSDSEFLKVMNYTEAFNEPQVIDAAIQQRLTMCDPPINAQPGGDSAIGVVESIFDGEPNGTTILSFWDEELIPGVKNKYAVGIGAGLLLLKFL